MSERQLELAARRESLLALAAAQRKQMGGLAQDIKARLAGVDHGIEVARSIVRKPSVIAGAIAVVAFVGPRRLLSLAGRSARWLSTGRRVVKMLRR